MLMFGSRKALFKNFFPYCNFATEATPVIVKPILYGDEISPPVRFVAMTAAIVRIDLDFRKIDLFKNENKSEFFTKINSLQKVPAMVIGDATICDSHAIAIYLCEIGNGIGLYPDDPLLRARINQILFFNSSTLFRIDSEILSAYFAQQWPVNKKKIEEWLLALDFLESLLNTNEWLVGTKMRLCDICAVTVVTSMLQLIPLTKRHHKLIQWINKFENYPFFEINKKGINVLQKFINMMKNVNN